MDAHSRPERGATGIEIALIVTLVAMVIFGATRLLGAGSSDHIDTAAQGIANEGGGGSGGGGSGSGGGSGGSGGSSGGGGGGGGTTTTTGGAPPPTTIASTSTTATTTSTTAPTTTTTAPTSASSSFSNASTTNDGTNWNASAALAVTDQFGGPVSGATATITVRSRKVDRYGVASWSQTSITVTAAANGVATVSTGPYKLARSNRITNIEYVVTNVTFPGSGSWDGANTTLAIAAP